MFFHGHSYKIISNSSTSTIVNYSKKLAVCDFFYGSLWQDGGHYWRPHRRIQGSASGDSSQHCLPIFNISKDSDGGFFFLSPLKYKLGSLLSKFTAQHSVPSFLQSCITFIYILYCFQWKYSLVLYLSYVFRSHLMDLMECNCENYTCRLLVCTWY